MAKINARGTHRVGPTLFTEKLRPADVTFDEGARIYREAWRLRSDGMVQTRIISTRPVEGEEGHTTHHSSAFRNLAKMTGGEAGVSHDRLRHWLQRKGYTIVEESWR